MYAGKSRTSEYCTEQSVLCRAVVCNQLKSSSSLTFNRAQFPKPLNHEIILVSLNGALTPDPSSTGSYAVFWVRLSMLGHRSQPFSCCKTKHLLCDPEKSLPTHLEVIPFLYLKLLSTLQWGIFGNVTCTWAGPHASFLGCSAQDVCSSSNSR